jgi:peptidoglycan/LPS O-acetylase OafA/YrhL
MAELTSGGGATMRLLRHQSRVEIIYLLAGALFSNYVAPVALIGTFAFAAVSYRCIEEPFLRLKYRYSTSLVKSTESEQIDDSRIPLPLSGASPPIAVHQKFPRFAEVQVLQQRKRQVKEH